LYLRLRRVYQSFGFATAAAEADQHPSDTPITRLLSPASVAKACFRKMGVPPSRAALAAVPMEFPGFAMAAYYGGRTECRIRHSPVPATLLDFSSQYPAAF